MNSYIQFGKIMWLLGRLFACWMVKLALRSVSMMEAGDRKPLLIPKEASLQKAGSQSRGQRFLFYYFKDFRIEHFFFFCFFAKENFTFTIEIYLNSKKARKLIPVWEFTVIISHFPLNL